MEERLKRLLHFREERMLRLMSVVSLPPSAWSVGVLVDCQPAECLFRLSSLQARKTPIRLAAGLHELKGRFRV